MTMTDAPTLPSTPAVSAAPADPAPRNSAALIVAATLAFVGAAITIAALFPDYWDAPSFSLVDDTASLAHVVVFAAALVLAGALLLHRRSAPIGAAMVVVAVAFELQPRVEDVVTLTGSDGPRAGTGFSLVTAGLVLGIFAAVLSALVTLRPSQWTMLGGARPLAIVAALFGFAAAVGYAMNPFTISLGGDFGLDVTGGSPLDTSDPVSSRYLWAGVLVIVLLTVLAPVAVSVGGRIGSGLALGLLFGIAGIAALRLGAIYGTSEVAGRRTAVALDGAEGTWTFLAAGGAVLIVTWFGLAAGGVRRPRAASMPPVTSVPPPEEHVVTGDDPSAIVPADEEGAPDEPSDPAHDTAVTERARVDPMPAAEPTTTWNADDSEPDRPAE